VVIGDPRRGSCPGNWIGGSLTLNNNTHGVQATGNHVNGTENSSGNSGLAGR
jgi:hypothetical protein